MLNSCLIRVRRSPTARHRGIISAQACRPPCALGAAGITHRKREGDHATPAGLLPLREIMWRADRLEPPRSLLPHRPIARTDGWCDDPASPDYNRPVQLPIDASAETLWRDDRLYDILIVLGHNDSPPRPWLGSAIFFISSAPTKDRPKAASPSPSLPCAASSPGCVRATGSWSAGSGQGPTRQMPRRGG